MDRAKLVLSSDLGRRWTLAEIGSAVCISPVYLTQLFRQVEGLPLYRYQLQRRLARALDRLGERVDLTESPSTLDFRATATSAMRSNTAMGRRRCSFSATPASGEAFRLLKIQVEPPIRALLSARLP